MARRNSGVILRQVHALLDVGTFGGLSDRQLLDRFLARHDEVSELAFTVLVERHGPMVLGVCRRILVDPHDAEDAFQATFLVLVRKAGSVRVDGSVGRWLFGVATRVATRARADATRRRGRERPGLDRLKVVAVEESLPAADRADFRSILAEEIGRLPARLQIPVILCDLEGCSYERAGQQLGWPIGTVKSRLSRARARLRARLTRRGLGPEDLAINAPLLSTTLSRGLIQGTTRAAQSLFAGRLTTIGIVPASVATLTEGVLRTMLWTKFKLAIAATLLIMGGSAVVFSQAPTEKIASRPDAGTSPATPGGGADQNTTRGDELDVLMLDRAWVDAIPRRDAAMVNRILADDFEGIDSTGKPFTKATYLPDLRDGAFGVQPIELDEVKTRLFGETAVVTSRIRIAGHPTRGRMTNVYVKRQGRWQCVASHASGMSGLGIICPVSPLPTNVPGLPDRRLTDPSLWATRAGSLGNNCIACHEGNHQAPQIRDVHHELKDDLTKNPGAIRRDGVDVLHDPYRPIRTNSYTIIRPRVDCLVERIHVSVGEVVKKGDPLFGLFSTDIAGAKIEYKAARSELERDQGKLRWSEDMFTKKYQSEGQVKAARDAEVRSRLKVQLAGDKLRLVGLDDEAIRGVENGSDKEISRLTIRSPIDGVVIEVDAKLGNLNNTLSVLAVIDATSPAKPASP